jgi:hypothetical protein
MEDFHLAFLVNGLLVAMLFFEFYLRLVRLFEDVIWDLKCQKAIKMNQCLMLFGIFAY